MHSDGLSVNTYNRNDVVAFWHAIYMASEGYENRVGWTGNYNGKPGRTSATFAKDIERRVNFYRAMCGVPAIVKVNNKSGVYVKSTDLHKPSLITTKEQAAQEAALMMVRNFDPVTGSNPAISHDPLPGLVGWSKSAWNANAYGNLSFGVFGPGAISEYMVEELSTGTAVSTWNSLVGHRRWVINRKATTFGSGDMPPGSLSKPPTNVLYVFQKNSELNHKAKTDTFTAYPSPGFFPAPINSRFWSLSHASADFSSAKVQVTDSRDKAVKVTGVVANSIYAEPALLWQVAAPAASRFVTKDSRYRVRVTGIKGSGVPASHSYTVTLINPDLLTSNQSITGPAIASSKKDSFYRFTPPAGAEAVAIAAYQRTKEKWTETAESATASTIIDRTATSYRLIANVSEHGQFGGVSGARSFRLTFPTSYDAIERKVPDQSFELNRGILPARGAKLRFAYRRGYMTTTSTLFIETSNDGGVTWRSTGKPITGASNNVYDPGVSAAEYSLPPSAKPLRIRFRLATKPGQAIYTHEAAPTSPTGIFIDDITTINCDWLRPRRVTTLQKNATLFRLNSRNVGANLTKGSEWMLALRTKLGDHWFPDGPAKNIIIR